VHFAIFFENRCYAAPYVAQGTSAAAKSLVLAFREPSIRLGCNRFGSRFNTWGHRF
jgi:hypothetical protein